MTSWIREAGMEKYEYVRSAFCLKPQTLDYKAILMKGLQNVSPQRLKYRSHFTDWLDRISPNWSSRLTCGTLHFRGITKWLYQRIDL